MIEILNLSKGIATPSFETVTLDFLISKQETEVKDAIQYYRSNKKAVPAGHWMYRLCKLLDWGHESTFANYYFRAKDEEESICRNMHIYTAINKGGVIDLSMGTDDECVGFSNEHITDSNYSYHGSKWKSLEPIKIVHRPGIKGGLLLPDDPKQEYDGYCALSIDVPLLAIMYLGFKKEQSTKPLNERDTTGDFISGYLLPNMMYSQFTCIMQNMFISSYIYDGEDIRPPFATGNQLNGIVDEADKLVAEYTSRSLSNLEYATSLPAIWGKVFYEVPEFTNIATVNNYWGYVTTGLAVTNAIVGTIKSSDGKTTTNYFRRVDRRVRSERTFDKLPNGIGAYFSGEYTLVGLSV